MKGKNERLYELWEIYKDGKNDEVYEVAQCVVPASIGKRVKVFTAEDDYKTLVEADTDIETASTANLVTMYGCLGTAKYRKVEQYKQVTLSEALVLVRNRKPVFALDENGEYVSFFRNTAFSDIDMFYVYDLLHSKFFVKEVY